MAGQKIHRILRQAAWWVPVVFILLWIRLALTLTDLTPATMGPLGDALAPLGTMLVFYGLVGAFNQQREDREQAHLDRVEAHKDREIAARNRVADAYARWIPIARAKLREAERLANACNYSSWHHRDPNQLAEARQKLRKIGPLLEEVAIASTEVLLFEQDASLRERVQALPKFPGLIPSGVGERYHQAIVALNSAVTQRRVETEKLVADVLTRLSGTAVAAVEVIKADGTEIAGGPSDDNPAATADE